MSTVRFKLNTRAVSVSCAPDRRLLDILREDFGLIAAKPGCGVGRCGACMVWVDDLPANACLVMAFRLEGRSVRTYEDVAADAASAPVREAIARCGALQCGYCTPGLAMTLTHLHQQTPRPDREQAASLLSGNLCRCTGYGGIQRSIDQLFPAAPPCSTDTNGDSQ